MFKKKKEEDESKKMDVVKKVDDHKEDATKKPSFIKELILTGQTNRLIIIIATISSVVVTLSTVDLSLFRSFVVPLR